MTENKLTSRQFLMSFLFVAFILAWVWANPNAVTEAMQFKAMLLAGAIVVMFCFNDLAKKLIEKMDMFKGMFSKSEPNE